MTVDKSSLDAGFRRQQEHPLGDGWSAVEQAQTLSVQLYPRRLVAGCHLPKGYAEFALKRPHMAVIRTKLLHEGGPLEEHGAFRIDTVQPLRKPRIEVERNR